MHWSDKYYFTILVKSADPKYLLFCHL